MSLDKEILALREKVQKLESNLTHRDVDTNREEWPCVCDEPRMYKTESSDHGYRYHCLNCCGWSMTKRVPVPVKSWRPKWMSNNWLVLTLLIKWGFYALFAVSAVCLAVNYAGS